MSNQANVKDFVEKIMMIQAPAQNIFGGGIPGMMGTSGPANQAATTGGGDIIEKLKREAIELARMQYHQLSSDDIAKKAEDVEGLLLMASTLSVLTESQANKLIDELHTNFSR
jgi:hypothetical protein